MAGSERFISWRDENGVLRCNRTERTDNRACATLISGDMGGGAVMTLHHSLVMTEHGLRVVHNDALQPVATGDGA